MSMSRQPIGPRRWVAGLVLVWSLAGCMQWKPASLEPRSVEGKRVRATLESGSQLVLNAAVMQHDSLISVTTGQGTPLSAIRQIEVWANDGAATTAVVLTGGALVVVAALIWGSCCLEWEWK